LRIPVFLVSGFELSRTAAGLKGIRITDSKSAAETIDLALTYGLRENHIPSIAVYQTIQQKSSGLVHDKTGKDPPAGKNSINEIDNGARVLHAEVAGVCA